MSEQYKILSISTTTNGGITEYESTYIDTSGVTLSFSATTIDNINASTVTSTTYYGDGSNLTGIVASWDGKEIVTVGEDVLLGDLLYLNNSGVYLKASNSSETTSSTELRLATENINSGTTGNVLVQGNITITGLTAGDKYWVGSTLGTYTNTQPTGDGDIVRYIGTAVDTSTLEFNPDGTYIEISSTSGPSSQPGYRETTTSGNILVTDFTVDVSTTNNTTQTLPLSTSLNKGKIWNVKNSDYTEVSVVTVSTTSGQSIDRDPSVTSVTLTFPESLTFQSTGSGYIII